MRKVALRGLLQHKGRLVATFLAVALGVSFMSGVLTLTDTMNSAFDDLFADVYQDTDAVVRGEQEIGDPAFGGTRAQIDEALIDDVRGAEGVAAAEGYAEGFARVIDREGDPMGNPAMGAPTFGANWTDVDALNPFDLTAGRAPEDAGEMVIDRGTAEAGDYGVGDVVPVQTQVGVEEYEVVGISRFGTADSPGGSSYVMWTTEEAQRLVGQEGRFMSISVATEDGVSQDAVVASLRDALPADAGAEVLSGQEITEETQDQVKQSLSFITTFLLVFAIVSVFVGTFVIYNSFSIIVAQRTREMALLRAIGASRRQVRRSVLVEAVLIGLISSAVGFVLGLGIASLLATFFQLPEGALAVVPTSVATAIVTGLVVTTGSAFIPARRAGKVAPLAAMREVSVDTTGRSLVRTVLGLGITALGVLTVVAGAGADTPTTVGLGVAAVFVGVLFLSPALARPVSAALGAPLARLRGMPGALARRNAGRNPRRTSATAQALMIGVGIVAFILVINSSMRASIDNTLEENFTGDFVVNSGTFGMLGLPTEVAERIDELPETDIVAPARFAPAVVDGEEAGIGATAPGALDLIGLDVVAGSGDMAPGTVLIDDDTAESDDLAVGDPVEIQFVDQAEAHTYEVGGVYEAPEGLSIGAYSINLDDFAAAVPNVTDMQIFVQLDEGVSVAQAEPEIEQAVDQFATAEVQSVEEYKEEITGQLDLLLGLVIALLVLSIIIAMLGIANTVALSIIERTREIGLLRAVGMSRSQLRATIRWESAIIAVLGTVLGLAIGVLGGWGLVSALSEEGITTFVVPYAWLLVLVAVAGILGLAAALIPALRASRVAVLEAIAE